MIAPIYRILTADEWQHFQDDGVFHGSALDKRDGFIHLSAAEQVEGTLAAHFSDRRGLVIVDVDIAALGDAVRWETSRNGALFPHLYGTLPLTAVRSTRTLD